MTISIDIIQPFDVLIANVQFEDKPEIEKPRPVIVLNIYDKACTVLAIKVTSHAPREWERGEVVLSDWEQAGLAKPSVARCSKMILLEDRDIKARVGTLSERDREATLRGFELARAD